MPRATVFAASLAAMLPLAAQAATYTDLHTFTAGADGEYPNTIVAKNEAGTIFGTTAGIFSTLCLGIGDCGTLFSYTPSTGQFTTLHQFAQLLGFSDIIVTRNRLFGIGGGGPLTSQGLQAGIIYSMNFDGSNYQVLHVFNPNEGAAGNGRIVSAPNGGLIGTTFPYRKAPREYLFLLQPNGNFAHLHQFIASTDGTATETLLTDQSGNVFGANTEGGTANVGTVFEYNTHTRTFQVLYTFQNKTDGSGPQIGVIDKNGVIYGAAYNTPPYEQRGAHLFSLTPGPNGYQYAELAQIPHVQNGNPAPVGGPVATPTGALLGNSGLSYYLYQNGKASIVAPFTDPQTGAFFFPEGAPVIAPHATIYSTQKDTIYGNFGSYSFPPQQ